METLETCRGTTVKTKLTEKVQPCGLERASHLCERRSLLPDAKAQEAESRGENVCCYAGRHGPGVEEEASDSEEQRAPEQADAPTPHHLLHFLGTAASDGVDGLLLRPGGVLTERCLRALLLEVRRFLTRPEALGLTLGPAPSFCCHQIRNRSAGDSASKGPSLPQHCDQVRTRSLRPLPALKVGMVIAGI